MNWLDFIIIVAVAWFAFAGLTSGLVREVVGAAAVIVGVVLAGKFYLRLADDLHIVRADVQVDRLVAFLAIFAAALLAGQLAAGILKNFVSLLMLGPFDRIGGLVIGFAKGCMIVELCLIAFAVLPAAGWMNGAIAHSLLAPLFLSGVPWLVHLLPAEFRAGAQAY